MKQPVLILDVNNVCHRLYHAMPKLMHDEVPTAALYGFLRQLLSLSERFRSSQFTFCFDSSVSLRKQVYPAYKSNRKTHAPEEEIKRDGLQTQIKALPDILKSLGYVNIFRAKGYEADDLIASVCSSLDDKTKVICSTDSDLYQLLDRTTDIWTGKKLINAEGFFAEWKVSADEWYYIKAIAGCSSDCIEGVAGVGEITAVKYFRGELGENTKAYKSIREFERKDIYRNLELVSLPYAGCPSCDIEEDAINGDAWRKLCDEMGFTTIRNQWPGRKKWLFT